MYSLMVRDHFMIAHSFKGEIFGPAQALHGATYVVDCSFERAELDPDGLVVDIGLASKTLGELLSELNYRNLDDLPEFKGQNTTTEFLAREIFERMKRRIADGSLGVHAQGLDRLKVTLGESHIAWASFEGSLR